MARILEWKTWEERNKYTKEVTIHGVMMVDQNYDSIEELEAGVAEVYRLNKQRWDKVISKLKVSSPLEVPLKIQHQLQNLMAEELRQVYGKDRKDAAVLNPPKRVDLVRLAQKHKVLVGSQGWAEKLVNSVKDGIIVV